MSDKAPRHHPTRPLKGHCLCGAVHITVINAERDLDVCHCEMCQRWGGAFYAGLQADEFEIEGEGNVSVYKSSNWAERAFCKTCGSNLWFCFIPTGNRTFLAGLFSLPEGFGIKHQIFIDQKPDWYDLAQESAMKTGAEIIAEAKAAGFSFD